MDNDILFSIIVPIYNAEKYIKRCVNSILEQTYSHFELILIDDGSSDRSGKICDYYAQMDKRVVIIHKENAGVSAARNDGIKMAQGDYIGFVDADDSIESECLQTLYQIIQTDRYDCIIFGMNKIYQDHDIILNKVQDTHADAFWNSQNKIKEGIIELFPNMEIASACNKVYASTLIKSKKFVEMTTGEDFLFNIEVLFDVTQYAVVEHCLYNYYRNVDEKTRSNSYTYKYIEDIETVYKAVLGLFAEWGISNPKYLRVVNNVMYGMFLKVLQTLPHSEYRKSIKKKLVQEAIINSDTYSWKEKVYKFFLLLKGV